jgi:hypothetical protein
VLVKSQTHAEAFQMGLRSFVNEAKMLARFDHPALVKVHQFWEENGTAYMVMPFYEGPTLQSALNRLGRRATEGEVREWLMPLLDALEVLHEHHCFHRDIAPDNILLTAAGPILLDFGAARRVLGDLTHALTAMLKPGFAPIEQYGEVPDLGQGPWTDIFALASVLYAALSGQRPVPAVERLMNDGLRPLALAGRGQASPSFLAAVDTALALHPRDRPQSVAAFRDLLNADDTRPMPLTEPGDFDLLLRDEPLAEPKAPIPVDIRPPSRSPPPPPPPTPVQEAARPAPEPALVSTIAPAPMPPSGSGRRVGLVLAGTALLLALGWAGWRGLRAPPAVPARPLPGEPAPATAASATARPASVPPAAAASMASAASPPAAPPSVPVAASAPRHRPAAAGPATVAVKPARCSDILQKASLESLSPEEIAYLKKECR